jgi:SAM-dependent methyltransferase
VREKPEAIDWVGRRGEKWLEQLEGMEAMLAPLDEPLFERLRLEGPTRIAEVGSGGGGTALELMRRAPAGSTVHGYDISPVLVEQARARSRRSQRSIVFEVADMSTAAPPKQPYDRLVSRFGVMFFDAPHAAFGNLVRWLAPGGRFAFAVWGPAAENAWLTTARDVVAQVVDVPPTDPEAPGPFRYGNPDTLLALLDEAGFTDLDVNDWRGALAIGGGLPSSKAAAFALDSFSSFSELLEAAGGTARIQAERTLADAYSRFQRNGAVRLDAFVRFFTGTKR